MKLPIWVLLVLMLLGASCSTEEKHVVSSGKMEDIFYDLYLAEASINSLNDMRGTPQSDYLQAILFKHGVTTAQYDSSLVWYAQNADKYIKIYEKTLARLEKRNEAVKKEVDRYNEALLSPKGDSVQLMKEIHPIILSGALGKDSWTTRLNADKNYPKFKKLRFIYSVPFKADTSRMVVKLSVWSSNGKSEEKTDTLVNGRTTNHLELYADSLMSYVEVKVGFAPGNNRAYRVILDKIKLERIKIDSIPPIKVDTVATADSLKNAIPTDSLKTKLQK